MPPLDADARSADREPLLPIFLKLSGRLVVVVGGGQVATRKAATAANAGAVIRLIDPAPRSQAVDELSASPGFQHIQEQYAPHHLDGAALVFAAATPEVNSRIVADANTRGLWVNAASDPDAGDFFLSSVVRSGALTIAISSSGTSPAFARRVREKLEAEFDEDFATWVQLLAEIRPLVLSGVADEARRREMLDAFADWPWLERIRSEGVVPVRSAMLEVVSLEAKRF